MNGKYKIIGLVPALALSIGLALPAFAQEHSQGTVKNAYNETATALTDTKITTKVKVAFATGKGIDSDDIHVTTNAGVVTLGGQVKNSRMAARLVAIAKNTEGVRAVHNDLLLNPTQD